MTRLPHTLAALATTCLLAVAVASPRSARAPVDEPMTCPFCGGRFTIESFALELGGRLTLRAVLLLTGK
ncbi:MAG: hypothetical protein ACI8QZ_001481 [Chlamydiales bacterium]|jgi:hypothetical protein